MDEQEKQTIIAMFHKMCDKVAELRHQEQSKSPLGCEYVPPLLLMMNKVFYEKLMHSMALYTFDPFIGSGLTNNVITIYDHKVTLIDPKTPIIGEWSVVLLYEIPEVQSIMFTKCNNCGEMNP